MDSPIIVTNLYPHHIRYEPMRLSLEQAGFRFVSFLGAEEGPIIYDGPADGLFVFNYPMSTTIASYILARNQAGLPSIVMMDDPLAFFDKNIHGAIIPVLQRAAHVYTSTDTMLPIYAALGIEARLIVGLANPLFDVAELPQESAMLYDWGYIGPLYPQRFRFFWLLQRLLPELSASIVEAGLDTPQVIAQIRATRVNVAYGNFSDITDFKSNGTTFRSWEFPYANAFLLQEYRPLLADYFEEGVSMATFQTVEECAERIRYFVARPEQRHRIAARGREVIARYPMHTFLPQIFREIL